MDDCKGCDRAGQPLSGAATTSSALDETASSHSWSYTQCIGDLAVSGIESRSLVRNTGGGVSECCAIHPVAAGAHVAGHTFQLALEPRKDELPSRNGARIYLADECVEGAFGQSRYAALPLLGRTLSFTVDLSSAGCGCNAVRTHSPRFAHHSAYSYLCETVIPLSLSSCCDLCWPPLASLLPIALPPSLCCTRS